MELGKGQQITPNGIDKLFDAAFGTFIQHERETILKGVSEQSLCGRLALMLEREREVRGLNAYFVDTEYNRNGGTLKTVIDEHMNVITIRCDIIIHSRGSIPAHDNLLVIEMKRSQHPFAEKEKDRTRLRAMTKDTFDDVWSADGVTLPEHVCGYVRGFYLELNSDRQCFLIERYSKGVLVSSDQAGF